MRFGVVVAVEAVLSGSALADELSVVFFHSDDFDPKPDEVSEGASNIEELPQPARLSASSNAPICFDCTI